MRIFVVVLLIFFSIVKSFADCNSSGIAIWPKGKTIKQNTIFIINGYASSQKIIKGLNKDYPIYLMSHNQKVRLNILEINFGQYELTQAILKPEKELNAGEKYYMVIDNLLKYEGLAKFEEMQNKFDGAEWQVEDNIDIEKPAWKEKPKEYEKTYKSYGCGPAYYVIFDYKVEDNSEHIIKTTVTSIKYNMSTTYYISPHFNKLRLGRGMCAGEFTFDNGDEYEVEFTIMDASGNITKWEGDKIKFTKPKPEKFKE